MPGQACGAQRSIYLWELVLPFHSMESRGPTQVIHWAGQPLLFLFQTKFLTEPRAHGFNKTSFSENRKDLPVSTLPIARITVGATTPCFSVGTRILISGPSAYKASTRPPPAPQPSPQLPESSYFNGAETIFKTRLAFVLEVRGEVLFFWDAFSFSPNNEFDAGREPGTADLAYFLSVLLLTSHVRDRKRHGLVPPEVSEGFQSTLARKARLGEGGPSLVTGCEVGRLFKSQQESRAVSCFQRYSFQKLASSYLLSSGSKHLHSPPQHCHLLEKSAYNRSLVGTFTFRPQQLPPPHSFLYHPLVFNLWAVTL